MTRKDSPVRSIGDLGGRKVAVSEGTTTERVVTDTLKQRSVAAEIVRIANNRIGLDMLLGGKVDAMAGDQATLLGLGMASGRHADLVLTGELLSAEALAFPLPRNDADFRLAVNRALSEYPPVRRHRQDVGMKWFGPFGVQPTSLLLELYRLNSIPEK